MSVELDSLITTSFQATSTIDVEQLRVPTVYGRATYGLSIYGYTLTYGAHRFTSTINDTIQLTSTLGVPV